MVHCGKLIGTLMVLYGINWLSSGWSGLAPRNAATAATISCSIPHSLESMLRAKGSGTETFKRLLYLQGGGKQACAEEAEGGTHTHCWVSTMRQQQGLLPHVEPVQLRVSLAGLSHKQDVPRTTAGVGQH